MRLAIFWIMRALCVLLFFTALNPVRAAEEARPKRVLIISTGSRFAPGFAVVDRQLLEALGKIPSARIETYAENLDIIRFPTQNFQRIFSDYLTAKYAEQSPDLVILVYVGNLGITAKVLPKLFPRTPIILAGLTEENVRAEQFGGLVSGLAQRIDARATLELIHRLQPEMHRIVVIGGTAQVDRDVLQRVKAAAEPFKGRIEFDFWDHFSMAQLRQMVTALPPKTAILFARMFRDAAGQAFTSSQAALSIAQTATVPVYVMTDTNIGTGAVGGAVTSVEALGNRAGELARLILTGTAPASLPFEIRTDSVPMFDWRALKRWGIPESRLPPGSIVRFRPESLWALYRWYIIAAVIIIGIQSAMIVDLLLQHRRRQRSEAELRESRKIMELATSAGELGLWSRDLTGGGVWVNAPMRSLFGFGAQDAIRFDDLLARIHPDDRDPMVSEVQSAQTAGLPFQGEFRILLPNGAERWVLAKGRTTNDPGGGRDERRMGVVLDITDRKRAEEKLRESEENFRRLVETTSAVLWQADVETWNFTYVGPQAVKLLGYPLEQWYEKDFWVSHIHPDDRQRAVDTCLTMSKTANEFEFEYRMMSLSGEVVWVHDIGNCQHSNGSPQQLRGLMLDITERKHSEQAMRESEGRFRTMANSAPVMIWMSGSDKGCTFFNKGWLDFTGRSLEQELGNGWAEGVHPDDFDRCLEIYTRSFDARQEFETEYRLRRNDGEYRWVLDHGVPRSEPDGRFLGYIGTATDITEQRRDKEALEKERSFLRQVIDTTPNFIFAKDRDGRFTLANRAVADAYGTTVENLIGKTDADFNKNQEEVESFQQDDREVIDTLRERFIAEERITDARGKMRWLQTVKRPIIDNDGSAKQMLGASTDITLRKETEIELREQRLELAHVARISTMGELAASLAHELNQPLTAILSNAQAALRFLSSKPADLEEVREILQDIVKDNSRAGEVIRRMRALVKKEELDFAPVDLASLIRDVVALVHSDAILQNIHIALELDDNLPPVQGDKVQLQQVMLNLLLNAFDAMKDCPVHEREVKLQLERDGMGVIRASVSDCGTGLSGDKLDKIFQPFYTTKGEGLGMGLSICRSIIEAHGGRLWAENNTARGATFYFTIPVEMAYMEAKLE